MTRQTSQFSDLKEDEPYLAIIQSAKVVPSKKECFDVARCTLSA